MILQGSKLCKTDFRKRSSNYYSSTSLEIHHIYRFATCLIENNAQSKSPS